MFLFLFFLCVGGEEGKKREMSSTNISTSNTEIMSEDFDEDTEYVKEGKRREEEKRREEKRREEKRREEKRRKKKKKKRKNRMKAKKQNIKKKKKNISFSHSLLFPPSVFVEADSESDEDTVEEDEEEVSFFSYPLLQSHSPHS